MGARTSRRLPVAVRASPRTGARGSSQSLQQGRIRGHFGGFEIVGYKGSMMTMSLGELAGLSASALTGRLYTLRSSERVLLVEFLRALGELDARKAYLDAGFS